MPASEASAVLLGRVSRGERKQDPESQLDPLRGTAARLGWNVAREVRLTLSAWDDREARRVWDEVLAALHDTGAGVLMVWSLDRLARGGVEDAFGKVRHLEEHLGVGVYSLQEPFLSTATADRQTRELLLAVLAWAARWESQRRSERLRAKADTKRREAGKLGQRARWGRGHLPTAQDEVEVRRLRAPAPKGEGLSFRAIAKRTGIALATVHRLCSNPPPFSGSGSPSRGRKRSPASGRTRGRGGL